AQLVAQAALLERFPGQLAVVGVVVGHQDRDGLALLAGHSLRASVGGFSGKVTTKVDPCPGVLRAVIEPPWRSAIFLQMASPTPVPSYTPRPCSRWKTWKMRSR